MFHCLVKLCFGMAKDRERMNCKRLVIIFANHAHITHTCTYHQNLWGLSASVSKHFFVLIVCKCK